MDFEWDENKQQSNIKKHGIDFVDAVKIWLGPTRVIQSSSTSGETRWLAIGLYSNVEIAVVFTMRRDVRRIISARRASRNERKEFGRD